ncbi:hypothetical protein IPJ63_01435 [Candidatus Nomurabacteria bacterium]|nr:MAG: hypothetical protein IPJ63_01435 [Candidatus Nomurabacteria bacterium]
MYDEEKDLNEEDLLEVLGGDDVLDDTEDLLSIDDVIATEDGGDTEEEEDEAY